MSQLTIGNASALITRTIETAPSTMMFRELIQNAIEAALSAINPLIVVTSIDPSIIGYGESNEEIIKKLCIWNNGTGLHPSHLREATNLSTDINKLLGVDKNFGLGFKVASLMINKIGFIFISCHNGIVSMVRLYKDELTGNYGREDFYDTDAESPTGYKDVADITHLCNPSNSDVSIDRFDEESDYNDSNIFNKYLPWDTSEDWSAVILLGNELNQNTVTDPYNLNKPKNAWVAENIYLRYFSIPKNVTLRFDVGHGGGGKSPVFESFYDVIQRIKNNNNLSGEVQDEIVDDFKNSGIKIWYVFENWDTKNNRSRSFLHNNIVKLNGNGFSSIVYRNENYDVLLGAQWVREASKVGIPFGAKYLRTFVILPDNYECISDQYRISIGYKNLEKSTIKLTDFSDIIRNNMPEWFKDKIKEYAHITTQESDDFQNIGQELINKLLIQTQLSGPGVGDGFSATKHNSAQQNNNNNIQPTTQTTNKNKSVRNVIKPGSGNSNSYHTQIKFPEVHMILTEDELENSSTSDLRNKPAEYIQGSCIFINGLYAGIEVAATSLISNYIHYELSDLDMFNKIKQEAIKICRNHMAIGIIQGISYALSLKTKKGFTNEDIDSAVSSGSLITHAERSLNDLSSCHNKLKIEVTKISEGLDI